MFGLAGAVEGLPVVGDIIAVRVFEEYYGILARDEEPTIDENDSLCVGNLIGPNC